MNLALENAGIFEEKVELRKISNNYKNLIFIGMHHIGRKEFYNDVANKIDSLQRQGFVVYYEKLKKNNVIDSISNDVYKKKFRKMIGLTTTKYYDTINKVIGGKLKYKGNYKLTNQFPYNKLHINMETAKNIDVKLSDLIKGFEFKYGAIALDDCDKQTKSDSSVYDCDRIDNKSAQIFKNEFIIAFRNKNLANAIMNSTKRKIVVIYGKIHFEGLKTELQGIDKNWK